LAGVARAAGVSLDQSQGAVAAQVAGLSTSDGISGFNVVSSVTDYLFARLRDSNVSVDPADYLRIYSDLKTNPNSAYQNDPAGHFRDYGLAEILSGTRPFVPQAFDWSSIGVKIPGFASGGFHAGGLRLVGERGPEIEATGAARIYSASQTQRMLGGGNGDVLQELKGLRNEVSNMRRENTQLQKEVAMNSRKSLRIDEQMRDIGQPVYTVDAPV
jgi:hypothetical protein